MNDSAEHPQIGLLDVPQTVIDEAGIPLGRLAAEFGATVDERGIEGIPADGWRVLQRWETGAAVIGAPVDAAGRSWRIAQLGDGRPGAPSRSARVQSETMPLRPSRAERSRGLEMRWPEATGTSIDEALDGVGFSVDIVNTGESMWRPDGDPFHVVGVIVPAEQKDVGFGWMSGGGNNRAVPLAPGEYARLPVNVGDGQWRDLEPGSYGLRAFLPGLAVPSPPPLPLELTAEAIERHRPIARGRSTPAEEKEQIEAQIVQSRALVAARHRFSEVADAVMSAATREAARDEVQRILGCDPMAANTVVHTRLVDVTDEAIAQTHGLITYLEGRLADL
ncbi:hypothetical protein DEU34_3202 [Microbacterium sp. AG1240]|uniref:hypothetical protein n=1 Tax=Microbacterium sp. AG1240 TaxID=2183992 RepID=UPI000EAF9E83|nr:hypothetical protein [Microbacterium sp. AG1240]RKT31263.1 hypothetical protein DEU34_3202 [Microbacterium sp. AG1240]